MKSTVGTLMLGLIASLGLTACSGGDGAAENLGEQVDDAVAEAGDRAEDAADEAREAADEIGDAVRDE